MREILGCSPVSAFPRPPTPDAAVRACSVCSTEVYVAKSSLALLAARPTVCIVCHPCIDAGRGGRVTSRAMTGAQVAEALAIIFSAREKN